MNKYEIEVYEGSQIIIAQTIGNDVSEEDAQRIVKQFEGHKYITVMIQKDMWLTKHRGKEINTLYVYARYPVVDVIHDDGFKLRYELKY